MLRDIDGIISFIGIGSNIGDPAMNCTEAIERINRTDGIKLLRSSSFYKTEPFGFSDQDWFINAVIETRTGLSAHGLFDALQLVERSMGRKEGPRWGPRIIDLDILMYGQYVINEENLKIPHPDFHKRRFVLQPFFELAPYVIHPSFGISIKGLLDRLEDQSRVERAN